MKILRIYNEDLGVDIEYITDIVSEDQENFTVMDIRGLKTSEEKLGEYGISFKQLPYNINTFKSFCEEHGFGLTAQFIGTPIDQPVESVIEPEPAPSGS